MTVIWEYNQIGTTYIRTINSTIHQCQGSLVILFHFCYSQALLLLNSLDTAGKNIFSFIGLEMLTAALQSNFQKSE